MKLESALEFLTVGTFAPQFRVPVQCRQDALPGLLFAARNIRHVVPSAAWRSRSK
ncbi:hypothetical protein [Sinomonas terrae]|uniref:Uncharacterized protein n=1 Tax=Sinomonas terrae TaxID=2908838 RepID=A0ABS9U528_9MICC|nr:hypothetical protein [Sinomonas terrae]MCH6471690.1 hypothetical protein [Sinomonas terrae]